jgi:essential MCU regulator, mitochondrial
MASRLVRTLANARLLTAPARPQGAQTTSRTAVTRPTGAFLEDPERQQYGLFGIAVTVFLGLFIGATISQNMASFLEENELFVPSDDDDDDD